MSAARLTRASLAWSLAWLLAAGVGAAATPDEELARCAAIAGTEARLACYDALAAKRGRAPAVLAPVGTAAAAAPSTTRPAAMPPLTATRSASSGNVSPAPSPAGAAGTDGFGLTAAQRHPEPQGPESIDARVASISESRLGQTSVVLDNGQIWVVREGDVRLKVGDAVTIRRAALGSYLMQTPSRHGYRVNRTQ